MATLRERLAAGEVLLADGGLGSLLLDRGLEPGGCPEELNLSRPAVLEEIAAAYAAAGAELVTTNTFGGSPLKLAAYGLEQRTEAIAAAAVAAARAGAAGRALVAASVGPSGKLLKPFGDTEPEVLRESFRRQARALAAAGPDLFIVETMIDLNEARMAVEATREAAPDRPVLATMTFDPTPRGFFTVMGVTVAQAAEGLAAAGADAIGSNCGNGIETMLGLAGAFAAATELPIVIQANAGLPENRRGEVVYPETPELFASKIEPLVAAGARIIGGCCGTTPDHIRAMRAALDAR